MPRRRRRSAKRFVRRSRRGFAALTAGSFSAKSALTQGAIAAGGAIAVNFIMDKVAEKLPEAFTKGYGRAATKAAAAIGLAMLARRMGLGKYAAAIATGGIVVAGLDAYSTSRLQGLFDPGNPNAGVNGMGNLLRAADGTEVFDPAYTGVPMAA